MGQNKWRYSKKIHVWNRMRLSLRGKKIIINQTLLSKICYIGQICTIPNILKKNIRFPLEQGKVQPPRHLFQLSTWTIGLGILDIETQLSSLKINCIQSLLNPTNVLWKNLTLYQLNLILNHNQGLALFW